MRYPKADVSTPSVNINIECDRDAVEPQITMEHLDDKTISFRLDRFSCVRLVRFGDASIGEKGNKFQKGFYNTETIPKERKELWSLNG